MRDPRVGPGPAGGVLRYHGRSTWRRGPALMTFDTVSPAVLAAALLLDWTIGDPRWLWRRVRHPVALLGAVVDRADGLFNRGSPGRRLAAGAALCAGIAAAAAATGLLLPRLFGTAGWIVEVLAIAVLLAQRDLLDHVRAVATALRRDGIGEGRRAVARIVGRDTATLDGHGVARAAIESCAENYADGVVAPLFWTLVAGLPGLLVYKAVNTLDSMIGHRDERHRDFGRVSARVDDLLNIVPARLSGILAAAAATTMSGSDPLRALRAMRRDARRHRSPNAGWPEAAFAGALGIAIAGPRRYGGATVDDAWMGDGRSGCTAGDIDAALALYVRACLLAGALAVLAAWLAG